MSVTDLIVNFIGQDKSLSQVADKAGKAVNEGLGRGIEVGAKIGTAALAGLGVAVAGTGVKLISLGSDAEEMLGKFNKVFAVTGGEVTAQLEAFGEAAGRSKFELMEMASTFGDTFKPMGFAEEAAADLSIQMTTLATDLGSFNNMEMDEALQRLQGTLIGSHENALAFGVIINENTLKAELAAQGWDRLTGAALEQAKVQARINLLMAGTTDAQGDAIDTAGGFANQMRGLTASLTDAGTELGMELLPAVTKFVPIVKDLAMSIIPIAKAAISALVPILGFVADHMNIIGPLVGIIAAGFTAWVIITTVTAWIAALTGALGAFKIALLAAGGGWTGFLSLLAKFSGLSGLGAAITGLGTVVSGTFATIAASASAAAAAAVPAIGAILVALGPIILIVAVIAGVIALFVVAWRKNWGDIQGVMAAAWERMKLTWGALMLDIQMLGLKFEEFKQRIIGSIVEGFVGLVEHVSDVIDWFKNLGDTIKDLVLPDWLQRASPSPIEMTFSGLRGELKHLTREELPAFGTQMQGLNRISHDNRQTSIVNNITTSRVNVPGFNRTQAAFATGDL